jgi:ParB family chromosome partitioning protein
MAKKRGLGRGLDALLGAASQPETAIAPEPAAAPDATEEGGTAGEAGAEAGTAEQAAAAPAPQRDLRRIPIELIERSRFQPRRDFDPDALRELADSISAQGVIQPIVVRPLNDDRFELIAGERRWRAAQQAGLAEIPAVVREDVSDQAAMAMALIENIQRRDLNPLEEASALHRLLVEFELTHQQVAQAVGKPRTAVTNLLRVLELNEDVREHLEKGRLDLGHAKVLLGLQDGTQSDAAHQVVLMGLSVRETEKLVRRMLGEEIQPKAKAGNVKPDPNVQRLLNDLSDRLGAKVDLKQQDTGKGKLVISYNSLDELDGILAHIQ